uniref:Glutaredoxin domain-containing protein n=1 Tax=Chrysolophus pictus TaxID=9089 RepID=A0A8C3LPM9_CHRPC
MFLQRALRLGGRFRMGNRLPTSVELSDAAAVNQIQEVISDNCVVIFSKTTCFYCKMAKKLFEGLNVNYTAVELDVNKNGSQFQDILEQMTGGRTERVNKVFNFCKYKLCNNTETLICILRMSQECLLMGLLLEVLQILKDFTKKASCFH